MTQFGQAQAAEECSSLTTLLKELLGHTFAASFLPYIPAGYVPGNKPGEPASPLSTFPEKWSDRQNMVSCLT